MEKVIQTWWSILGNEKLIVELTKGDQWRIGRFRGTATPQLHDDSERPTGNANKFPATGPKAGQDQTGHPGTCIVNRDYGALSWAKKSDHFSGRTVHCRKKFLLACLGSRQQFVELFSSPQFRKQWVGLKGAVGAVVMFNGAFQQAQGSIAPTTVRQQGSHTIARFWISRR